MIWIISIKHFRIFLKALCWLQLTVSKVIWKIEENGRNCRSSLEVLWLTSERVSWRTFLAYKYGKSMLWKFTQTGIRQNFTTISLFWCSTKISSIVTGITESDQFVCRSGTNKARVIFQRQNLWYTNNQEQKIMIYKFCALPRRTRFRATLPVGASQNQTEKKQAIGKGWNSPLLKK